MTSQDEFHADVVAIQAARTSLGDLTGDLDADQLDDCAVTYATVGHLGLTAALADLADSSNDALRTMLNDVDRIMTGLDATALSYQEADADNAALLGRGDRR